MSKKENQQLSDEDVKRAAALAKADLQRVIASGVLAGLVAFAVIAGVVWCIVMGGVMVMDSMGPLCFAVYLVLSVGTILALVLARRL